MDDLFETLANATKPCNLQSVTCRFSVGDTVNYCNGLIFKIAKINEKAEVCYDDKGMWYALVNCVNLSQNGR